MKILVLSNLYPPHYVGGYELHCDSMVDALRSRGHEVHVLTSDHGVTGIDGLEEEPGVTRALKIHGLFGHPYVGIVQLKAIELHNNEVLLETLQQIQPDLVYVWSLSGLSKSMLFTLQRTGTPTVFAMCDHWLARSEHADVWLNWWNRDEARLQHRLLRNVWTWSGRRSSWQKSAPTNPIHDLQLRCIHFCSRSLRDFTANAGYDVQHGAVIYCPVDTERFTGVPRSSDQPMRRLLFVGRLHEDKGIWTALRAMTVLRGRFDGELTIYGRGDLPYERQLASYAEENQLKVSFRAPSSPEKMPEIYRSYDALIFPSEWPEPFALTPLEAMAAGLPVIGTTTGGSSELFRNGENALTYEAGNFSQLADQILYLAGKGDLRTRIAKAGQDEVRARFARKRIADEVENYLLESVERWVPSDILQSNAA